MFPKSAFDRECCATHDRESTEKQQTSTILTDSRHHRGIAQPLHGPFVRTGCGDEGFGTTNEGKPVRFRVKLDGTPPRDAHGADTNNNGAAEVQGHRIYQLIRHKGLVEDRTFEIEFLGLGALAFAFT